MRTIDEITARVRLLQNEHENNPDMGAEERLQILWATNALLWVIELSSALDQLTTNPGSKKGTRRSQ